MGLLSLLLSAVGRTERARFIADPRDSAPPPQPEPARSKDIIDDDDRDGRRPVRDATVAPYSGICLIQSFQNSGDARAVGAGTGWLVAPDIILTAAHVVCNNQYFSGATRPLAGAVHMWFGFNNEPEPPFGAEISTKIAVPAQYKEYLFPDWDVAVIKLERRVGDRLGWFDMQTPSATSLKNADICVAGYPGEPGEEEKWFRQFEGEKKVLDVSDTRIYHNVDTTGGQSGAPVFVKSGKRAAAFGVHARGRYEALATIGMSANFAVRFRPELLKWIKEAGR